MVRDRRRDTLFDDVRYGRLSPDEAEAEAQRLGVGPLVRQPDPAGFDPLREAHWTVAMAVAWIAWRTPDQVRDAWDVYRAKRCRWGFRRWRVGPDGEVYEGHVLEPLSQANLSRLGMLEAYQRSCHDDNAEVPSVASAVSSLLDALRQGALKATGRTRQSRSRTNIPTEQWQDLEFVKHDDRDIARCERRGSNLQPWYEDVTMRTADIRAIWPPLAPTGSALPLPMRPACGGYMPLSCAAHWIATAGATVEVSDDDRLVWQAAYKTLLNGIEAGKVEVIGLKGDARERIEGFHFADCRVSIVLVNRGENLIPDGLSLLSYPYIDDVHWRDGFDDSLRVRHEVRWSRLMVNKDHVAALWPFEPVEPAKTGVPGRPTSKHLVIAELAERARAGRLPPTLTGASRDLAYWLSTAHPAMPRMGEKAIANAIREEYRKLATPK